MNKEEEKQSDLIRRLREQVHKSFMQITEMEKLFNLEMEHTKEEFDEREKEIRKKEDEIKDKYQQIEANIRLKEYFMLDVGDLDVTLDEIAYKKEETLKDSGIDKINEMLTAQRMLRDPEAQISKLNELQLSITTGISNPPSTLFQLFKISNELCLENCRLRQELLNSQDILDVYKAQMLQNERQIEKYKRSQRNLQKHNEQLNDLYIQESEQNTRLQEEIRQFQEQSAGKRAETDDLKCQISKLSDLLRSSNRIDISKINFKLPLNRNEDRSSGHLRMSSNTVLLKPPKSSTPSTQISYEGDNNSLLQNLESNQKYFKRRGQRSDNKKND